MGRLTTHVLDTAKGRAATGVEIVLRRDGEVLTTTTTNADGRTDAPLLEGDAFVAGDYELEFAIGAHFGEGLFDRIPIRVRITDATEHYHVPLLASPWSYSTYRGS